MLAEKETQTTRALHRRINCVKTLKGTSYSIINRLVRDLEQRGYIKKAPVKERAGGITNCYQLRPKAHVIKFFNATVHE